MLDNAVEGVAVAVQDLPSYREAAVRGWKTHQDAPPSETYNMIS